MGPTGEMDERIANKVTGYHDKHGRQGIIRYGDLMIQMGEDRVLSLADCLLEEQERVAEFERNAESLSEKIHGLDPIYDEIEGNHSEFLHRANERVKHIHQLPYHKRIYLLDTYYTLNSTHDKILRKLTAHMLEGSEGEFSAHEISLLRRVIDYTCYVMRKQRRKTNKPGALHAIEAARGAAKNCLSITTVVATLLHDVLEERLDEWTEQLINRELADAAYGEYAGKQMKEVPVVLRHRIIQKYIDGYNDRASGIFFHIGLTLYDHVRHFPVPARHYESLHAITEMVSALSRRKDMSYYSYLQDLLYPKANAAFDTIRRDRLLEELEPELPHAAELLDSYLRNVQNFYQTGIGEVPVREEVRRNAFREILAKILDRMNNTRDMDRGQGFSIARRLYGTGFKNIFFLQAVEDKFRRPAFNTEERRLIEVKFISKPKVAGLYQILEDIEALKRGHQAGEMIAFLENEIERYKATRAFRRITPPGKGGHFDGLIYLFNNITLGKKSDLEELERHVERQSEALVAFKAIMESYLIYPALMRMEQQGNPLGANAESSFRTYRIEGMGPSLEHHSNARKEQAVDLLHLKTFNREVIS